MSRARSAVLARAAAVPLTTARRPRRRIPASVFASLAVDRWQVEWQPMIADIVVSGGAPARRYAGERPTLRLQRYDTADPYAIRAVHEERPGVLNVVGDLSEEWSIGADLRRVSDALGDGAALVARPTGEPPKPHLAAIGDDLMHLEVLIDVSPSAG